MKRINIILLACLGMLAVSACEAEDRRYQGPLFVEFSPDQYGQKASPSGISKMAPGVGADQIGLQLIGLAQPQEIEVNFRLADQIFYLISLDRYAESVPDGMSASEYRVMRATGVYGVDYSFDGLSGLSFDAKYRRGSIRIAANSQFGRIPIQVLQKGGARIFFVLEDSNDIRANKPTALLTYETPVDKVILLEESFASDPFGRGWSDIDKDGDGYSWESYNNPPSITSDSYRSSTALHPENYLVSPLVNIPASAQNVALDFEVGAGGSGDFVEQYRIVASEAPITFDNCRNATIVQDYVELTAANSSKKFTPASIDLSAYKGKQIYFAIVHGNCTDQYYILIRNLSVYTY